MNYKKYYEKLFLKKGKTDNNKILWLLKQLSFKKNFIIFHVGGTNGKGSVSSYLAQGFRNKYPKVGIFTSPHLISVNERIKINNTNISDKDFFNYSERIIELYPEISFFNLTYIISLLYFMDNNIQIAILEIGIGGRNDVTNLVHGEYGTITSIGLDHTEILGNTLEKIAKDKAGIIHKDMSYFLPTNLEDDLRNIFIKEAENKKAKIINIKITNSNYKNQNIALAAGILQYLSIPFIRDNWKEPMGRTTKIYYKGMTHIIDVAHNLMGIKASLKYLKDNEFKFNTVCLSLSKDKDITSILDLLKNNKDIKLYVFQNSNMRAYEIDKYKLGIKVTDIKKFINTINKPTLFIGSFYFISDVIGVINE